MNYADILMDSRGRAADGLLATKIIDLMDKLRLGDTENAARRWIWELLQNAKDVAFENHPVSVIVELNSSIDTTLVFKHNGQPFSSDNITSLIHQVSSKKRKVDPTIKRRPTGKFGTGFLSTHLLSEMVDVHGVVKEIGLPYKEFCITLDRTATDSDDVLASVSASLDAVNTLLNSEKEYEAFNTDNFNTKFVYHLQGNKVPVALSGIADLHISLPYTLAFTDQISQVAVTHERIIYNVGERRKLAEGIEEISILEDTGKDADNELRRIVVLSGERAAIALEIYYVGNKIGVKAFNDATPRLFCDFPLVGSHDFPFPVIINSPDFNINEPRNGVWLTDKEDKRVKENEVILEDAMLLFHKLLIYAAENNWSNIYEICKTHTATQSEWLSKSWFDDKVLKILRSNILTTPLITTSSGKKAIINDFGDSVVFFPDGLNNEIRENIWKLSQHSYTLPLLEDVHNWAKVIWKNGLLITLPVLAREIENSVNIEGLFSFLNTGQEPLSWLNLFYSTMNMDIAFEDDVIAGKFAIIPNQSNSFKTRADLKLDKEKIIQEEIKDALLLLGTNNRDLLLSSKVYTGTRVAYHQSTEQQFIDEMNLLLSGNNISAEQKYAACDFIISLFPAQDRNNIKRNNIYDFSKIIYPGTVPEKTFIRHNPDIWKEADKIQIRAMVINISDKKNIQALASSYFNNEKHSASAFLHAFVDFLVANEMDGQLNLTNRPMLPDQNGNFKIKDALNLDDGEIPEELKVIAEKLGYDIRASLLDKAIFLELPDARTITANATAGEISSKILPAAAAHPRTDEIKEACRLLLLYFLEEPERSQGLFPQLYGHKHKLYDDEEIANNMKQAEDVKLLMEELNISSLDQMRELLGRNTPQEPNPELLQITTEILASWGVNTREEYDSLMGADVTGRIFRHYSIPTTIMFDKAQLLIERAKTNIMAYLIQSKEYETEFMDLIAPTVLAGITKAGVNVHVVFRPGDNGEVLFYYPSEKAALDLDNAELWVDDGQIEPFRLTLGRILQTTGINRIPIYGNY